MNWWAFLWDSEEKQGGQENNFTSKAMLGYGVALSPSPQIHVIMQMCVLCMNVHFTL